MAGTTGNTDGHTVQTTHRRVAAALNSPKVDKFRRRRRTSCSAQLLLLVEVSSSGRRTSQVTWNEKAEKTETVK